MRESSVNAILWFRYVCTCKRTWELARHPSSSRQEKCQVPLDSSYRSSKNSVQKELVKLSTIIYRKYTLIKLSNKKSNYIPIKWLTDK